MGRRALHQPQNVRPMLWARRRPCFRQGLPQEMSLWMSLKVTPIMTLIRLISTNDSDGFLPESRRGIA